MKVYGRKRLQMTKNYECLRRKKTVDDEKLCTGPMKVFVEQKIVGERNLKIMLGHMKFC